MSFKYYYFIVFGFNINDVGQTNIKVKAAHTAQSYAETLEGRALRSYRDIP